MDVEIVFSEKASAEYPEGFCTLRVRVNGQDFVERFFVWASPKSHLDVDRQKANLLGVALERIGKDISRQATDGVPAEIHNEDGTKSVFF